MKFLMQPDDWNYFSLIQAVAESLFKLAATAKQAESQQEVDHVRQKMNELLKQLSLFSDQYGLTGKPDTQAGTL